jgi:toluene monooxygenase electron transfer component
MVSIIRGAAVAGLLDGRQVNFFYGGRNQDDIPVGALIDEIIGLGTNVDVQIVLSEDASATYQGGFVHDAAWAKIGDAISDYDLYFAGPAVMAAAIQKRAYETGLAQDQMFFDEFY